MTRSRRLFGAALGVATLLSAVAPSAQIHGDGAVISYRVFAPTEPVQAGALVEFGPSFSLRSSRRLSGHVLSARVPVTGRVTVVAELPVAYREYELSPEQEARYAEIVAGPLGGQETYAPLTRRDAALGVGNPLLGAEVTLTERLSVEAGVRVPLGGRRDGGLAATRFNPPDVVGRAADPVRDEAYATGTVSLAAGVRFSRPVGRYLAVAGFATSLLSVLGAEVARGPVDASSQRASSRASLAGVWGGSAEALAGPVALGVHVAGRIDPTPVWRSAPSAPLSTGASLRLRSGPVRPAVMYQRFVAGRARGGAVSVGLEVPLR